MGVASAGKLVLVEQLAHFELDQLEQLGIVDHVDFVHVHNDVGHPDLARQQDVLARLRHRPIGRTDDQNGPVHLRRTGDHVLHIVGMPRAVNVGVVPVLGLVLDVRSVDGDAARLFLRRRINLVVRPGLATKLLRQHQRDGRRQSRLAMIHMPNRPHIHMRLRTLKFAFCHRRLLTARSFLVLAAGSREPRWPFAASIGAHDADRTRDLSLTKGVLYH